MSLDKSDGAVWIVEDNDDVRAALSNTVRQSGIEVFEYGEPTAFLEAFDDETPGCLLIDFYLPDFDGQQLYEKLLTRGCSKPVIFISGRAELAEAVTLMRMGAVDFVKKPFDFRRVMKTVEAAIVVDKKRQMQRREIIAIGNRLNTLSAREHEVMEMVVDGMATKNIARQLDISPKTVEVHRSNITKKMRADSVPHLVRMVMSYRFRSENI